MIVKWGLFGWGNNGRRDYKEKAMEMSMAEMTHMCENSIMKLIKKF
jgi:hypothetical protein